VTATPTVMTSNDPLTHGRAGVRQLVVSEWTKFRSVRSTWISLLIIFVAGVGFAALLAAVFANNWSHRPLADKVTFDPVRMAQAGIFISQFVVGVLGILMITSEYSTGSIRTTLAAVPRRSSVVAAKAIVLSVAVFVVAEITTFASFFTSQAILLAYGGKSLPAGSSFLKATAIPVVSISSPGVASAVFRTGLYLTIMAVVALGIGLILRHSTGAISLYVGVLLIVPLLIQLLPSNIGKPIEPRLPSNIGLAMSSASSRKTDFAGILMEPWLAAGLLVVYAAAVLGFGLWLFIKRDA